MLNKNQLTGAIPPELGNLYNLNYLHLEGNGLTGRSPLNSVIYQGWWASGFIATN